MLDSGKPENKQERTLCVDRQLVQVRYLSSCDHETSAATANRRYAYLHQPSRPRQGRHVDGRRPRRWPMSKEATFPVYRDPQTRYRKWQACATGPAAMQTVANKLWRLAPPSAVAASFAGCCCCCCPTCDVRVQPPPRRAPPSRDLALGAQHSTFTLLQDGWRQSNKVIPLHCISRFPTAYLPMEECAMCCQQVSPLLPQATGPIQAVVRLSKHDTCFLFTHG